jgi:hypothetical protein
VQPRALTQLYELRARKRTVATLEFRGIFGSLAIGESEQGCWSFKRVGFLQTAVTVRECDSEEDLAILRHNTWKGGGTLELPGGPELKVTTNLWRSQLDLRTRRGNVLLRFKPKGVLRVKADVELEPAAGDLEGLPWMVMLGMYLLVMMRRDDGAMAVMTG